MSDAPQPRKIPFILIVSVMVNLLVLGALAGHLLRASSDRHHRFGPPGHERTIADADRDAVRNLFRQAIQDSMALRQARNEARLEVSALLAEEDFDQDAVEAAFLKLREADLAANRAMQESMIANMRDLPAAQRQRLAAVLVPGDSRRRFRRHSPADTPPPE